MDWVPQGPDPFVFVVLLLVTMLGAKRLADRWSRDAKYAEDKSSALLHEVLSESECQHLERFACLMVPSPSRPRRTYCIPSRPGMVTVYESGKQVMRLCLQPVDSLPSGDMVLMLKLMIEANEEEYLRMANVQPAACTLTR